MIEKALRKDIWEAAGYAGLALGLVSVAYMYVTNILNTSGISMGVVTLISVPLWIAKFVGVSNLSQMNQHSKPTPKTIEEHHIAKLEKEITRLKLKIEAQDIMLDIIKEQTGVDPRKKFGVKQ